MFSEEEENAMVKKYKGCDENSVDFKYFCCLIDREFNPKNFAEQSTGKSSPIKFVRKLIRIKVYKFYI